MRGSPSTAFAARRTIFLFNKLFLFLINSDVAHAGFPAARSTLPLASRTRERTLARRHLSEGSSDRILRLVKAQNTFFDIGSALFKQTLPGFLEFVKTRVRVS